MKKKIIFSLIFSLLFAVISYAQIKPVVQMGHSGDVESVAFSPDGRFIASGSWDKTIKLWDVETGKLIKTFKGHGGSVYSVAYSPDGRYIASGSGDDTIKLWDVETGKLIKTFKGHGDDVYSVAYSPDGRYIVSGSGDKTIKLWEVETGRIVKTFKGHSVIVWSVAFSPDGRYIASGSGDNTIKLWDVETGKLVKTFKGHKSDVNSVAFSPDGRYIASGSGDNTIKLWEVETGKLIKTFKGHSNSVESVAFSPDGRYIASGSSDKTIKLWDVETGRIVETFNGHSGYVLSVSFSPDGRYIVSGSWDKTIKLWDVETGKLVATFIAFPDASVVITPEGYFTGTGEYQKYVHFVDTRTLKVYTDSKYYAMFYRKNLALIKSDTKPNYQIAQKEEIQSYKKLYIQLISPSQNYLETKDTSINLKFCIENGRTQNILIKLNGEIYSSRSILRKTKNEKLCYTENIPLGIGENKIEISIEDNSEQVAKIVKVFRKNIPLENIKKPNLYILSIGVSKYGLKYADDDAKAIIELFKSAEGKLFKKVKYKLLTNENATVRNIRFAINWLIKQPTQDDIVVLFVAGHGERDELGDYYFIAWDTDKNDVSATGVAEYEFKRVLKGINAKKILFLDTCKSGLKRKYAKRSLTGYKDFLLSLKEASSGSIIFAASQENGFAIEKPSWKHGAFTKAIIEGLKYKSADLNGDKKITIEELSLFVKEKVKELTNGSQKPETLTPEGYLPDFPIWAYQ